MTYKAFQRFFLILLSSALLLCFPATPINAAQENAEETIRVGYVDIDNFIIIDGSSVSGYGAEYLNKIAKYTGWNYEYIHGTWDELTEKLDKDEIDLLFPAGYSEERAERFSYSSIACCVDYAALVTYSDNNSLFYDDYENYNGITIGMIRGNILNDFIINYASKHSFTFIEKYYDNNEQITEALDSHEIDAMVMGALNSGKNQKLLAKFDYMPTYFIADKDNTELMNTLNNALFSINLNDPDFNVSLTEKFYGRTADFAKCFTREEAELVKTQTPLRVAFCSDYYPFEWYDEETGEYRGVNVDSIKLISKISGIPLEYIHADGREEAWNMIRDGKADVISGIYYDEMLSNKYNIKGSKSYINEQVVAVGKNGENILTSNKLTLAVSSELVGFNHFINTYYPHWSVLNFESNDSCLAAVQNEKADLAFLSIMQVQTTALMYNTPSFNMINGINILVPVSIGVSDKTDPLVLSIINKTIGAISDDDMQYIYVSNTVFDDASFSLENIIRYRPMWFAVILLSIFVLLFIILFVLVLFRMRGCQAKELSRKNEELIRANATKNEFFAHMSHDMRTPMNAIINFSDFGTESTTLDEAQSYHSKINTASKYLLGLINDNLDMNKIETGKLEISLEPCLSDDFIESIKSIITPRAVEKQINLSILFIPSVSPVILVDKLRLQQIIVNLMINAIKFTPEHGHVELTIDTRECSPRNIEIIFTIRDDGIGMTAEFLHDHLYHAYERENRMEGETGNGLGLSIVKSLVDVMGGTIDCVSTPNKGTVFTVVIHAPIISAESIHIETGTDNLAGKRVLLCEDNQMNTQIMVKLLENKQIKTECAPNGKIGFDMYKASSPGYYDAVLMDIRMPVMNGLEAAIAIRECENCDAKTIPIIAMTANAYEDDVKQAEKAGMDGYLIKPISPALLYSTLDSLTSSHIDSDVN